MLLLMLLLLLLLVEIETEPAKHHICLLPKFTLNHFVPEVDFPGTIPIVQIEDSRKRRRNWEPKICGEFLNTDFTCTEK